MPGIANGGNATRAIACAIGLAVAATGVWAAVLTQKQQAAARARYQTLPIGSGEQALATPARGQILRGDHAAIAAFDTTRPRGALTALPAIGDPLRGTFSPVANWPLVGIHAVLTADGNVLTYGTRADGVQTGYFVYDIWNPQLGLAESAHRLLPNGTAVDIFCNAQLLLPSGTIEMYGGDVLTTQGNWSTNTGNDAFVKFNPVDGSLTRAGTMNRKRWYATSTTLPSGEVFVQGGSSGGEAFPELRANSGRFRALGTAPTNALSWWYPKNFVGPDGLIFGYASNRGMYRIDPRGSGKLTSLGNFPGNNIGDSSTSVMYRPGKILQLGGGSETRGASVIDINGATPSVTTAAQMQQPRHWGNATVLADGRVFASGGSANNNDPSAGVSYASELYDPASNTWTQGAVAQRMRLYHATALLLPDATVLTAGGGALGGGNPGPQLNLNAEIYYPPYLFNADGTPASRPIIEDVGMDFAPGQAIEITSGDAAAIGRVTLVKAGSVTHSFDMDQRFLELSFTRNGNTLTASLPANPFETTPGFYMLFVFNAQGVPSEASMVRILPLADLVVNGDFEVNSVPNGQIQMLTNLQGWKNTAGTVETWRNYNGSVAALNDTLIEIDANGNAANQVYQDVAARANTLYELSFLYSPRPGYSAASNAFQVYWNQTLLGTYSPNGTGLSNTSWTTIRLKVTGTGSGADRISFREADSDGTGSLIDDIRLVPLTPSAPVPNNPPTANFSVSTTGLTAQFTDTSTDSDGRITVRSWNFGDGATSTAANPANTYATAGTYTVTLTVTDDDGATSTRTSAVTVATPAPNTPPTANFASTANELAVQFSDTSTDSDGTIASRSWNFGDGTTSTAANPAKAYAAAGTYAVTLTVTDDDGATATRTGSVTVVASSARSYSNGSNFTIPDNSSAGITSSVTVSGRSGNAPANAQVAVNIVHSNRGDLVVDLIAPDGTVYNLHNRSGGSTDNIVQTYTVNLSSETLNGTWRLRAADRAFSWWFTGYIDSWSITF